MTAATISATLPTTDRTATAPIPRPRMSNPMPVAFGLFAFALCLYAVRFVDAGPATIAANSKSGAFIYVLVVGGIAETLCGVLGMIRGQAYQGT